MHGNRGGTVENHGDGHGDRHDDRHDDRHAERIGEAVRQAGAEDSTVGDEPVSADQTMAAERLIFFSDAVVAIAITLLALDLPLPVNHNPETFRASIRENTPEYLSFLISFAVIGLHWARHNRVFRYVARLSGRLVLLNFTWLLLIVVTPYMTRLLGSDDLSLVTFGMYAITQALQTAVFAAMAWTLDRQRLFRAGTPVGLGPRSAYDSLHATAGFAISVPVYALIGAWAFVCWWAVPFGAAKLVARRRRSARAVGSGDDSR